MHSENFPQLQAVRRLLCDKFPLGWEIFIESRREFRVFNFQRLSRPAEIIEQGLSARYCDENGWKELNCTEFSVERLSAFFGVEVLKNYPPSTFLIPKARLDEKALFRSFDDCLSELSGFQQSHGLSIRLEGVRSESIVVNSQNEPRHIYSTEARLEARWLSKMSARAPTFEQTFQGRDPFALIKQAKNSLPTRIAQSKSKLKPWPAPQGNIAVVWSPTATAKLTLPLVRLFEGDGLSRSNALFEKWPLARFNFDLCEIPHQPRNSFDAEGTERPMTRLTENGDPKNCLSDSVISQKLKRPNSANARRTSYLHKATVGSWCCLVEPLKQTQSNVIEQVGNGLYVQDLELYSDPLQPECLHLSLTDALLIQDGNLADPIEPVRLKLELFEALSLISAFSDVTEVVGLKFEKREQNFLTECVAPESVSHHINIPGTVPTSYYW